jgi:hypothetical protein
MNQFTHGILFIEYDYQRMSKFKQTLRRVPHAEEWWRTHMAELPNTSLRKSDQLSTSIGTQEVQATRVEGLREKASTSLREGQEVQAVAAGRTSQRLTTPIGPQEVQATRVEGLREKAGTSLRAGEEVQAVRAKQFERKSGKGKESQ